MKIWQVKIQLHHSLLLQSASRPDHFTPGKIFSVTYTLDKRLGTSQRRSGLCGVENSLLLSPEVEPRPEVVTGRAGITYVAPASVTK
jgi:hypothetical protein